MEATYHSSRSFMVEHFYFHLKFIEVASLSPYQSRLRKIIGRSIFIFFFTHAIVMQLYAILKEYRLGGRPIEVYVALIFETLTGILMFALYLTGTFHQKTVKAFLQVIVADYENSELEARQIMKTSMRQIYIISMMFALAIILEGVVTLGCPFLTPLLSNRIISTTYKPILSTIGNFEINRKSLLTIPFCYNCICLMSLIVAVVAVFHAFITCIAYIIAKSRVVNYHFQKLRQRFHDTSTDKDASFHQTIYEETKIIVKDHHFCYEQVKRVNEITRNIALFVMFLILLLISVAGAMVVIEAKKNNVENCIKTTAAFAVIMFGAFLMSYAGQKLVDISEDMFANCYDCGWDSMSVKSRKMILFMILRGLRPCKITVGPATAINFENFTKLLNTSMSYITVMISLI